VRLAKVPLRGKSCASFSPNLPSKTTSFVRVFRGLVLRARVSLIVIAFSLAGFVGEAGAQSNRPPPDTEFYPKPPAPYHGGPPRYVGAPLPPPGYGMRRGRPPPYGYYPSQPYVYYAPRPYIYYAPRPYIYRDANGAPLGPYFDPQEGIAPPPPQSLPGGELIPRPPADIGAADTPSAITGSVRSPAEAAAVLAPDRATVIAALPPEVQPEQGPVKELPPNLRRQLVAYVTAEPAGTIIIDTPHTYLYLVLGDGKALRYSVGVGREGFTWSGTERISRMKEWPDWLPPKEMIARQPYLPRFMAGGETNPLGARAMYLGNTEYRIHGTNQPSTIGTFVSSGCIRLTNEDVEDLYSRVSVGTRVVVLPGSAPNTASSSANHGLAVH
jgi:lipoprotein-anchoring transpeptidase ErfK/SrfK